MKDTIYREDAIKAVEDGMCTFYDCYVLDRIRAVPSADSSQGYWTKTDVATYRCSKCGKIQIADDDNELNYCCCCGSRNKVRRKGADDE